METGTPSADAGATGTTSDAAEAELAPAAELSPTFSRTGPPEAVPNRLVLQFDRAIAGGKQRRPGPESDISLEPATPGEFRFTSPSTLVFIPERHLDPGTSYRWTISKLEVRDPRETDADAAGASRILEPKEPWSYDFETPRFEFVGLSPAVPSERDETLAIEVQFSAPLDREGLERHAEWRAAGRPVPGVEYREGPSAHVVRALLRAPWFDEDANPDPTTVEFRLEPGLRSSTGAEAPGANDSTMIQRGPPLRIESVELDQRAGIRSVEVRCRRSRTSNHARTDASTDCAFARSELRRSVAVSPSTDVGFTETPRGFRIDGNFGRGSYWVRVGAGLETRDGAVLRRSTERTIDVPGLPARVEIPSSGRYVTRGTWRALPIRHRNTRHLRLVVRRVPRPNLVYWMSQRDHAAGPRTANRILERRIPVDGELDRWSVSSLDLRRIIGPPESGIYEVELSAGPSRDIARWLPTDLALVAKRAPPPPDDAWSRNILVWALDAEGHAPRPGARIELIRRSGDVLARCETDPTGACRLTPSASSVDSSPPFAIVARLDDDVSFLKFDETRLVPPDRRAPGPSEAARPAFRAEIFTDRSQYTRSSDVRLLAAIRARNGEALEAGTPVSIVFVDPEGRRTERFVRKANRAGLVSLERTFSATAAPGEWRVTAAVDGETIASRSLDLTRYARPELRVRATLDREDYTPSQTARVEIRSAHRSGGSPSGNRAILRCRIEPSAPVPPRNDQYSFAPPGAGPGPETMQLDPVETTIGPEGEVSLDCPPFPSKSELPPTARLVANVEVVEPDNGRTASDSATATLHGRKHYVGLRADPAYVEEGRTHSLEGMVVDSNGRPAQEVESVDLEFLQLHRGSDRASGKNPRAALARVRRLESTRMTDVEGGRFNLSFTPTRVGNGYLVRAQTNETSTELELEPERTRLWRRRPRKSWRRTPRPAPPSGVEIDVSEPLATDARHSVTIRAPYAGDALVAVETDRVLNHEWIDVQEGANEWTFEIDARPPSVRISAFVIRADPAPSDVFTPDRAFGAREVRVAPASGDNSLKIDLPNRAPPGETLKVGLDASAAVRPRWVLLRASHPEPSADVRKHKPERRRVASALQAPGVETFETYGWTLARPTAETARHGPSFIDEPRETADGGRTDLRPRDADRWNAPSPPTSWWSGPHRIPSGTDRVVEIQAPNRPGELRVSALAFSELGIDRTAETVQLRAPVTTDSTAPRLLRGGDRARVSVAVTNHTERSRGARVELDIPQPEASSSDASARPRSTELTVVGEPTHRLRLAPDSERSAHFTIGSDGHVRPTGLEITVRSADYEVTRRLEIGGGPDPPPPFVRTIDLDSPQTDVSRRLPAGFTDDARTLLWATPVSHAAGLARAARLPWDGYGGLRSTSAMVRVLLSAPTLARHVLPAQLRGRDSIQRAIRDRIEQLQGLQLASGGFATWPDGESPEPWTSGFATATLLEAREKNHDVGPLEETLDWLEKQLRAHGPDSASLSAPARAYLWYVLAHGGRGDGESIRTLLNSLPEQRPPHRHATSYVLKAALFEMGDRRYEEELRAPYFSESPDGTATGPSSERPGSSARRLRTLVAHIQRRLFGTDALGPELRRRVSRDLSARRVARGSLRATTWAFSALAPELAENVDHVSAGTRLTAESREIAPTFRSETLGASWSGPHDTPRRGLTLEVDESPSALRLIVAGRGLRPREHTETNAVQVERRYVGPNGGDRHLGARELGERVYSIVELENGSDRHLEDVVVIDGRPAGWSIEDIAPGSAQLPAALAGDPNWSTLHRADLSGGALFVGDLAPGERSRVIYSLRATRAGSYRIPPVRAVLPSAPVGTLGRSTGRRIRIDAPARGDGADVLR